MPEETSQLEKRISQMKLDLGKISEERWRAALSRKPNEQVNARIKAAEKTIENCESLGKYVAVFSEPLARQIAAREAQARKSFEHIRVTKDPDLLHQWIKRELVPSTRFAERLGHMAASASKVSAETASGYFHKWPIK